MRVACIGECMVEVACSSDEIIAPAQIGYGGDTLNTALYLARQSVSVDYHSALGDDRTSDAMLRSWQEEGIGIEHVEQVSGATPGLYLVRTDENGERSFQYWRDQSPARRLCALPGWPQRARKLETYDWLYFSAITLSILDQAGRKALFEAIRKARSRGVRVAFDSNYRARHWKDTHTAREIISTGFAHADIALPTFDDERALFSDESPGETLVRLLGHGVSIAAIKLGAEGCLLHDRHGARQVHAPPVLNVVDTTAAGDAFNAGFIAGLIHGETAERAALRGHWVAGIVIQHRGAIAPRSAKIGDMPIEALDTELLISNRMN